MITIGELTDAGRRTIELARQYRQVHHRESALLGMIHGYLDARFGSIDREHAIYIGGSSHPKRIDFRQSTLNSVVMEVAMRTRDHGNELYGSTNRSELRKLARVASASMRYLLLLDMSGDDPHERSALKETYDGENAGPGKFARKSVRIVYVHPDAEYDFIWRPWRA
jgi:hypothetical protein